MPFYADLHIHSKYSRACSKDCDLEHLAWWARRKGISLVGTGDFTHPAWNDHLHEMLVPAEPGLFRLRPEVERDVDRTLPVACRGPVRFMLSVEISTIYKRGDRTRKVHHLIYFPDLDAVHRFNTALGRIGNLGSDGRPILGLDSRDLLEITLEASRDGYLVPAHVWTPWFSALGSKSGFDAIEDCYADLADHVFALETGLSSDPLMNWRVSGLDRYRLVSNSDAHSPPALGREATVFDTDLDYYALREALRTGDGLVGSMEFFPEEGKYHLDGHRKCDVRLEPEQSRAHGGRCPACGKPLTLGVLYRVEELADHPEGRRPEGAAQFWNFVALPEIMGEILGVGPKSKRVDAAVCDLVNRHGPELTILQDTPAEDVERSSPPLAEALRRMRRGEVIREGGYDGEYGVIRLFEPGELHRSKGVSVLFDVEPAEPALPAPVAQALLFDDVPELPEHPVQIEPPLTGMEDVGTGLLDQLDTEQRAAAGTVRGPLLIVAGPGTGKTRTLTHRIAHLVRDHGVAAHQCLAITFTRRAAEEMRERLAALVPDHAAGIQVSTFHGLGAQILRDAHDRAGLSADFRIADEAEQLAVLQELTGTTRDARRMLTALSRGVADPGDRDQYAKALKARDLVDFDGLVALPVTLLEEDAALRARYQERWPYVSVDEYQDVDETQYRLLRLLAPPTAHLCAIGDPDQAIYRFRGADVGFFLRFAADYPTARTVALTRNYRSTAPIVLAASQAIGPGTLVRDRRLTATRRDAEPARVRLYDAATADAEAQFVVRTVDQLLGGSSHHSLDSGLVDSRDVAAGGLSYSDIAVLYRTDAQSRVLVDALTHSGMPFQKRSHDRLADRPGVAAIARELRFTDETGAGTTVERVRRIARALVGRIPHSAEDVDERAGELHAAVDLLAPLVQRCEGDVPRLLAELAVGAEVDTLDPRADRISLLTLHAAKGLEFPVVFLVGCEDGLLPLRLPGHDLDAESLAEERRLFFVGLTRAQDYLFLSHARSRVRQGSAREMTASTFLGAIDPGALDRLSDATTRKPKARQLRLL